MYGNGTRSDVGLYAADRYGESAKERVSFRSSKRFHKDHVREPTMRIRSEAGREGDNSTFCTPEKRTPRNHRLNAFVAMKEGKRNTYES